MSDTKNLSQSVEGNGNILSGRDTIVHQASGSPKAEHLWRVITHLAENLDQLPSERELKEFGIEDKMSFNGIQRFAEHIRINSEAHYQVEDAYKNAEVASGNRARSSIHRFLRNEASLYEAQNPCATGDDVVSEMINRTRKLVGAPDGIAAEDVYPCCDMVVIHAFTACVFLKAPLK